MSDRSANESIKGYIYQFNASIATILNLYSEDDEVEIEGIEDIDIHDSSGIAACQYKYYEGTEYNHSVVAGAIRAMLSDFSDRKKSRKESINYRLIGYYKCGKEKLTQPITVEFMKDHFLTYHKDKKMIKCHEDLVLSDSELLEFINCITIDIDAQSFEQQRSTLLSLLMAKFKCDETDAEVYYYNIAISNVAQIACKKSGRSISKATFCEVIDKKDFLLNRWLLSFKGRKYWIKLVRNKIRPGINLSPFQRVFVIDFSTFSLYSAEISHLVIAIHKAWSSKSIREPNPFSPMFYLHGVSAQVVLEIKLLLQENKYEIIDGHPFLNSPFIITKLLSEPQKGVINKIKILNTIDDINRISEKCTKIIEYFEVFTTKPFTNITTQKGAYYPIQVEDIEQIREIFL